MPDPWDSCQGKLLTGYGTIPKERNVLQSKKLEGDEEESSNIEFGIYPAGFHLALVQHFVTMFHSLPVVMVMYILCLCVLEVGDLCFDFTAGYS